MKTFAEFYVKDYSGNIVPICGSDGYYMLDARNNIRTMVNDCKSVARHKKIYNFVAVRIFKGSLLDPQYITDLISL